MTMLNLCLNQIGPPSLQTLTSDLVLEPVGDVVAEYDAIAELQGRGLPGQADAAWGERVTLHKLRRRARN